MYQWFMYQWFLVGLQVVDDELIKYHMDIMVEVHVRI